jgi:SAM-dependent methyltransferase
MEAKSIDPAEFRSGQRQQWNVAAHGWRTWAGMIDRATGHVSERLVEMAGIEPGHRVLDIAAGYGQPSLTAAGVAGPDGSVVATDISAEMLAYGRERAADTGLDNIEFVESDAASLDYPEGSFDAALSRWGIIFEPDAEGAAGRVRGFLKPGGRFAIASWGEPPQVPFLSVPMRTALDRLQIPGPPPGTPGPLSRPTPEALGGLLEAGGFSEVEVEETNVTFAWESPQAFTGFVKEIAPPITSLIDPQPEDVQEDVWRAIGEAAAKAAGGGPEIRLDNVALLASGRS